MKLINIGHGNMVAEGKIIAIVSPESAPIKRTIQDARDKGSLIDATYGRKTKSVIIMESDHVILSARQPAAINTTINAATCADIDDFDEQG